VNQLALALVESLRSQLADLVRSVSADASLSWLFIWIGAATDEILRRVAGEPMAIDLSAGVPLFEAGAKGFGRHRHRVHRQGHLRAGAKHLTPYSDKERKYLGNVCTTSPRSTHR
jgi:hypothetical protein